MRIAALRPYGNPKISDHWDVVDLDRHTVEVLPRNATNSTIQEFLGNS
jgi:hypothetical protein